MAKAKKKAKKTSSSKKSIKKKIKKEKSPSKKSSSNKKKKQANKKVNRKPSPQPKAKKKSPAKKIKKKAKKATPKKKASRPPQKPTKKPSMTAKSAKVKPSKQKEVVSSKQVPAKESKVPSKAPKPEVKKPGSKPDASKPVTKQESQAATPQPKPKLVTPKKPSTPVLKIILCGPHSVYWIPNDTVIQADLINQGVHADELKQSETFKSPNRREEFLRARWLYHRVAKIKDPLIREETGLPKWPADVIGSISHKDGHVMFAKADTATHYGLGIDVEKLSKVRREFEEKICNEAESLIVDRVEALARMSREEVLALIFSFKESIFKTHYPMGKVHFGFHDAEITEIAYERREIMARMNKQTSPRSPVDHQILGFYNFVDYGGERYIVSVAEERKPLVIDNDLKPKSKGAGSPKELLNEEDDDEVESEDIATSSLSDDGDDIIST